MKRSFHILLCACAMLCLANNSFAQLKEGDKVIITDGNGNYLAVKDNSSVENVKQVSDACFWTLVVKDNDRTANEFLFQSVSNKQYLYPATGNTNFKLDDDGKGSSENWYRYLKFENGLLSFNHHTYGDYYVYYDETKGWKLTRAKEDADNLQVISIYSFISVSPAEGDVSSLNTITLTAITTLNSNIKNPEREKITLKVGNTIYTAKANGGLTIEVSENKLTITTPQGLSSGEYTLTIPQGVVKSATDSEPLLAATYTWNLTSSGSGGTGPKFTLESPKIVTTDASVLKTFTLTSDVDIADLIFDAYHDNENRKVKLTHPSGVSYVLNGLAIKKEGARKIVIISELETFEVGTYTLSIEQGAIKDTENNPFGAFSYSWTVQAHSFATITPETVARGSKLEQITITATDNVPMRIYDENQIVLKNEADAVMVTTAEVNADNELVITPLAPLGNGKYTLTIAEGAVRGKNDGVIFAGTSNVWTVFTNTSIQHVKGFYSALGAGGYQQVHTVERTIYYTGSETSIPLKLAETNFFGYMRWYDYKTDKGDGIVWTNDNSRPRGNGGVFTNIKDGDISLGWFGWSINHGSGILTEGDGNNNTPYINPSSWGNTTRSIACDVSAYTDYEITRLDNQIVSIVEPRLSYRQIFHFKPATEMADRFAALKQDQYLEEYTYMAPVGTNVYLSTEFRYNGTDAENCYFYYTDAANKTGLTRITNQLEQNIRPKWNAGTTSGAFQVVSSTKEETQTYTLTANNGKLRIAKFTVTYYDDSKYGPVQETGANGSAKAIRSYAEMLRDYEVLEYNNFSFGQTPTSSNQQFVTTPLPWNETTYGFAFTAKNNIYINGNEDHGVPYYGQYSIVNRIGSTYWEASANHVDGVLNEDQAASQGYAIYVDGTTEPGVVASISTKVTLCGARTMYCSVWLRNPRPTGQCGSSVYKPIFRCNVQGRNKLSDGTYTQWEDVAVYFVGELECASKWNQVCFPIVPQTTYTECRVQVYNFGTGGNGNDFLLDDLCIYAEKLPMSSYQLQTESCCSPNYDGTTFTAAVLRIDYGSTTLADNSYQYYQIYNKTEKKPLKLTTEALSPYYHQNETIAKAKDDDLMEEYGLTKEQFGSILVRPHTFDPKANDNDEIVLDNPSQLVAELLEAHAKDNTKPLWGKCFVRKSATDNAETSEGDYYMYVVHLVPNIKTNRIQENYIQEHCEYTLRMTNDPSGLLGETLSCAVEIALPPTNKSLFRLYSEQIETTEFLTQSTNNCANELYTVETFIRRDDDPYSDAGKVEGIYWADWIYAHEFDKVYRMDYPHASDAEEHAAKDAADKLFEEKYHCTRKQVTDAFLDLRRVPTPADPNPNYSAKTFEEIKPVYFNDYGDYSGEEFPSTSKHYETLRYLHKQGWLQLATSSVSFYLGSESTARYWVFPIENSAKASDGVTPLHDCPDPRWVEVSTRATQYDVNLFPLTAATRNADPRISSSTPVVRVLARLVNNTIEIPVFSQSAGDYEVHFTGVDGYLFETNDDTYQSNPTAVKYNCSKSDNAIVLTPASGTTPNLTLGKEYTLCIRMRNKDNGYMGSEDCQVGRTFVQLLILPDVVKWNPQGTSTNWHDDANWQGYSNVSGVDAYRYTPITGTNVIIPYSAEGKYPILNDIDDLKNHPYPTHTNYALQPTCGQIYFEPGAMIGNQHLLNHNKAFVDLVVRNMYWSSVAVPISGVVSGDMYIPHSGDENVGYNLENEPENLSGGFFDPFVVKSFDNTTMSRMSNSAFPFWLSVYNRTVQKVNENPDKTTDFITTNTASFATTNSLVVPLEVGHGYQLLGWGPADGYVAENLKVRLPKTEQEYSYYTSEGVVGSRVMVNRGENAGKLIYSPSSPLVLNNTVASSSFMFGNPTMAMIDLKQLIPTISANEFYYMEDDAWRAATISALPESDRYLMPMQSILMKMPAAGTSLNVTIDPAYIKTKKEDNSDRPSANGMPKRQSATQGTEIMTIYADAYGTKARCLLASNNVADNQYISGEDALFISSGVEADVNDAAATTPVNMYTISNQVPMMVDVRKHIDTIPLAMLIHDYYRTEKITMSFEMTEGWEKECYFCDIKTGERTLITDGLTLEVDMPANHEARYFIDGPDVIDPDNGGDIWSSTEDVKTSTNQVWAYSPYEGALVVASNDIIKEVTVYDIAGRLIGHRELEMQYNSTTFNTPTGACIVKAVLRDNTEHYISALVK